MSRDGGGSASPELRGIVVRPRLSLVWWVVIPCAGAGFATLAFGAAQRDGLLMLMGVVLAGFGGLLLVHYLRFDYLSMTHHALTQRKYFGLVMRGGPIGDLQAVGVVSRRAMIGSVQLIRFRWPAQSIVINRDFYDRASIRAVLSRLHGSGVNVSPQLLEW